MSLDSRYYGGHYSYYNLPDELEYVADDSKFILVSSIYGPGATACWYLTVLSCIITWTLHAEKANNDSIDANFIAMLSLPFVASSHLIYQSISFKDQLAQAEVWGKSLYFRRFSRSVEAALNITDTSLIIVLVCVLIAASKRCLCRVVLLSLLGILCLSAENIVRSELQRIDLMPNYYHFYRRPLAEYSVLLWATNMMIGILTVVCVSLSVVYLVDYLRHLRTNGDARRPERQTRSIKNSPHVQWMSYLSFLFLPVVLVFSNIPLLNYAASYGETTRMTVSKYFVNLASGFFPRSGLSIIDLDQAAALSAGLIVLGFSLYSALDSQYQAWVKRSSALDSQQDTSEVELQQTSTSVEAFVEEG